MSDEKVPAPPTAPRQTFWRIEPGSYQPIPMEASNTDSANIGVVTEEDRERLFMFLVPLRSSVICGSLYTAWQLILASARWEEMRAQEDLVMKSRMASKLREFYDKLDIQPPPRSTGARIVIKVIPHIDTPEAIQALRATVALMIPGSDVYTVDQTTNYWCVAIPITANAAYIRWALQRQGYVKQVLLDDVSAPTHTT